ncbi:MAG: hypothetical protein QW680_03405 [Pyrobaculum sp.]
MFIRDVLIFAGLAAMTAAIVASFLNTWEGHFYVPICTDCVYKLPGVYKVIQLDKAYLIDGGGRAVAVYAWAYLINTPLRHGEVVKCRETMYIWVINGVAYVSCNGTQPVVGQSVLTE